jgi:hypothetical protein
MPDSNIGKISWIDLTVSDAESIKSFYQKVAGWTAEPVDMRGYNDYNMQPPGTGQPVAGICNARGENADIPPQWMIYINVADLDASLALCKESNGEVLTPIKTGSAGRHAVIRDPAGAVCTLYEAKVPTD